MRHAPPAGATDPGRISRAARREVFARDGERCSYVDSEGRRCSARSFLQIDHIDPLGRGGSGACKNLRILCRAHNRFAAEQIFGRKHVERAIRSRQQRDMDLFQHKQEPSSEVPTDDRSRAQGQGQSQSHEQGQDRAPAQSEVGTQQVASDTTTAKLVAALTRLGFRKRPALTAVERARRETIAHRSDATVAELLRTAILLLTE